MRLQPLILCFTLLALAGCAGTSPNHAASAVGKRGDLILRADHGFDGRRFIGATAILIREGRVAAVGLPRAISQGDARVMDLGDATLLPGIIDAHVHYSAETGLISGLTAVRNLGAPLSQTTPPQLRRGHVVQVFSGPILTVPRGYPSTTRSGADMAETVSGPRAAENAVARLAAKGARLVKVAYEPGEIVGRKWPVPSVAWMKAVVAAAHGRLLQVTIHVTNADGVRAAIAAGVDELAHVPCVEFIPKLMRELARRRIPVVSTLHVEQTLNCKYGVDNARAFVGAGGTLLYGTDAGNPEIPIGVDYEELALLRLAGLSIPRILRTATADAGAAAGIRGLGLGRLKPGFRADVVAVRGDLSRSLDQMTHVVLVVAGGDVIVEHGRLQLPT